MKSPVCMYSIDWVQVYCHRVRVQELLLAVEYLSPNPDASGNHRRYVLKESVEFIHGYSQQYAVWYGKYLVATLAFMPRNKTQHPSSAAVKLANPVLYVADWHFILSDILATFALRAVSLTRVDLCCDFNYFLGGLNPETFIRKYVCRNGDSYIKHGSNQFAVYGHKGMEKTSFTSIRWGSRQSGVSVYLYNKTKELDVHKYKPWITNAWVAHSINPLAVWRVELSINSSGRGLIGAFNDLVHTLFVDAISNQKAIENCFKVYASQYFKFYRITKGCAKRKKDLPVVELLPTRTDVQLKPTTLYSSTKSCASEMRTIKALEAFRRELENEHDFRNLHTLVDLDEVISAFRRRSYYANMCTMMCRDMAQDIENGVKSWITTQDLRNRLLSSRCIRQDNEYVQEVAHRIAARIASLAPAGIMT